MTMLINFNTITNAHTITKEPSSIDEFFHNEKFKHTDINEHLETIKNYASYCNHVTEMGTRDVVSTWALLAARPKKIVCIDINPCPIDTAKRLAEKENIEFEFKQADTIHPDFSIEETDLLFIDTWHVYSQLRKELIKHSGKVRKCIILHDTTTYEYVDEDELRNQTLYTTNNLGKKGLWPAVMDFLDENSGWYIRERFFNNNGLTILARR
jgi:hypothetical protein